MFSMDAHFTPKNKGLTHARLCELLSYDPSTGVFHWLVSKKGVQVGREAGSVQDGYVRINIDGDHFRAHHLAWFYVHGKWPSRQLDHRNQVKTDNRIRNLRLSSALLNRQNTGPHRDNRSGLKGVSFNARSRSWVAYIQLRGKRKNLGYFPTPQEASDAYRDAAKALHAHHPFTSGTSRT
jgi:hypothetical protein